MTNFIELKALLQSNFQEVKGVNFADIQTASRNALIEFYGLKDLTPREIKSKRVEIMALIEEVIDEALPAKLLDRVGDFAEVKQFARDAEVVFQIKGKGKRRAYLTIKKGQRGGLYHAARLDDIQMSMDVWTETVSVYVTLEEILLGKYSLADLMANILDGFVERLYVQVIEALQAAYTVIPNANKAGAAGIDTGKLDDVIRVIAAYGQPVIMGFHKVVAKINNSQFISGSNPNVPTSDLDELKAKGYIGQYKGTPIVRLPNYIIDENTNAEWLLDESFLFILPAGAKPVKVALKGDITISEITHATGSMEQNAHKLLGVGILINNNIGLYEDQAV